MEINANANSNKAWLDNEISILKLHLQEQAANIKKLQADIQQEAVQYNASLVRLRTFEDVANKFFLEQAQS